MGLKTLRLQLRFLLPLTVTLVIASYLSVPFLDRVTLRWFTRDLNGRGLLLANAMSDSVTEALDSNRLRRLKPLFEKTAQDERLYAMALCSLDNRVLGATTHYPESLSCSAASELSRQSDPTLKLTGGGGHCGRARCNRRSTRGT